MFFFCSNFCQFLKNNQISFQIKVPNFLVYFILSSERTKYGKRFQIYKSKRYLSIQTNKDIVNCYEIENRTILLKNQLEIEKSKEIVKDKKKDKSRIK